MDVYVLVIAINKERVLPAFAGLSQGPNSRSQGLAMGPCTQPAHFKLCGGILHYMNMNRIKVCPFVGS
jgi:hypothetical protein